MEQKTIQKLQDNLCEVLDDFAQNGIKSAGDVETVKHALSGYEKLLVICAMEQGQSGRRYYDGGSYDGGGSGRSYDGGSGRGSYDGGSYDGGSGRRRRSYGSYDSMRSGHDMRQKLERMMDEAESEQERRVIQEAMKKL